MKLIFVGSVSPKALIEQQLKEETYTEYAADTFQRALLVGFEHNDCDVELITAPSIMSFPKYRKFIQRGFHFNIGENEDITGRSVGFVNLPVIKLICKFINEARLLARKEKADAPIVVYGVTSFQLLATTLFARKNKKYLIVPDLPEYMSGNRNIVYRALKAIDRRIINRTLKYIDGFVLLSDAMAGPMRVCNKPKVVVEGIYSHSPIAIQDVSKRKAEKVVLYTGKIEARFGLRDLLEAFTRIQGTEYRLWICGGGDVEMVNEYTRRDSRIVYYGCLSRDRVLEMQQEASLLVNPRHSNEEFTKYSFPSKTMEYMASGTPTLMCRLEGIPKEYHQHLFFFEDESIDGMSARIQELLNAPFDEMSKFGAAASAFIIDNKNAEVQTKKILEMIFEHAKTIRSLWGSCQK